MFTKVISTLVDAYQNCLDNWIQLLACEIYLVRPTHFAFECLILEKAKVDSFSGGKFPSGNPQPSRLPFNQVSMTGGENRNLSLVSRDSLPFSRR